MEPGVGPGSRSALIAAAVGIGDPPRRDLTTAATDVNVHYIHKRGRAMPVILTVLGFMWWWPLGL